MKVLVVGASENVERYSNRAMRLLKKKGHQVLAFGLREGIVEDMEIKKTFPPEGSVDTVTLYVGPDNQPSVMKEIIGLKPRRVIFNPGTENPNFYKLLEIAGIGYE